MALLSLSFGTKMRSCQRWSRWGKKSKWGYMCFISGLLINPTPPPPPGICGQPGLLIKVVVACLPQNFPTLRWKGALLRRRVTKGPSVRLYFRMVSPGPWASQKLAATFSLPHNSLWGSSPVSMVTACRETAGSVLWLCIKHNEFKLDARQWR